MTSNLSRKRLNNPAQGTAGDATLYSNFEAMLSKLGDSIPGSWGLLTGLANTATATMTHDLGIALSELKVILYTYTGTFTPGTTVLTRATTGYTVIANATTPTLAVDVTNNSGGTVNVAVLVLQHRVAEYLSDLLDCDTTGSQDGQALVFDAISGKFKPGASGDASFKLQSISTPNLTLKGGYLLLADGRELATYSGTGSGKSSFGVDLTMSLTTILGSAPANATSYYLYIDTASLGAVSTITETGRRVYPVTITNFVLSTVNPTAIDRTRYVPRGVIKSATTGTAWSGTGADFQTLAFLSATVSPSTGIKNYIKNPDDAIANWFTSGAGVTVATSTSTSRPDNNSKQTCIVITRVSGTTDYAYTRFSLDTVDLNKLLGQMWDQSFAGAAGDFVVQLWSNTAANYSGTYTQLALPTTNVPSGTGTLPQQGFTSPGSAAPYLELRIVAVSGTTPLYLNNVTVTNAQAGVAPAVTDYVAETIAFQGANTNPTPGTTTSNKISWMRILGGMVAQIEFKQTAAGSAGSGAYFLTVPNGQSANGSILDLPAAFENGANAIGSGQFYDGANIYLVTFYLASPTRIAVSLKHATSNTITDWSSTAASMSNATLKLSGTVFIPIAAWAGQGALNVGAGAQVDSAYNTNVASTASDTVSFATGLSGISFSSNWAVGTTYTRRVRFQNPIQPGDYFIVEVANNDGKFFPIDTILYAAMYQNNTVYGARVAPVSGSPTDVDVIFGNGGYAATGGAYGGNGNAWSGLTAYQWRVRKCNPSSPVGYGLAGTDGSAGLVAPYSTGTGVVYSGTYTPTLTGVNNITAVTAQTCMYSRVGSVVTVSGYALVDVNSTATGCEFIMSLPISSNFAAEADLQGVGSHAQAGFSYASARVRGDTTNKKASVVWYPGGDGANREFSFTFQYVIK